MFFEDIEYEHEPTPEQEAQWEDEYDASYAEYLATTMYDEER